MELSPAHLVYLGLVPAVAGLNVLAKNEKSNLTLTSDLEDIVDEVYLSTVILCVVLVTLSVLILTFTCLGYFYRRPRCCYKREGAAGESEDDPPMEIVTGKCGKMYARPVSEARAMMIECGEIATY